MSPLLLYDVRRYTRAALAPTLAAVALTVLLGWMSHATRPELIDVVAPVYLATTALIPVAVTWLGTALVVTARQPRRDQRASDQLRALRERAQTPGRLLIEVRRTGWPGPAGQHVHALHITHGTTHDIWLPETVLPIGAWAVLDVTTEPVHVIGHVDHRTITRAHRHDIREAARRRTQTARTERGASQRERIAAADVVREAEDLLRRQ